MNEWFRAVAASWVDAVADGLVEGAIVCAVVGAVWLCVRRWAPAQLGYLLFLLVLVKLALPFQIPAPACLSEMMPERWVDAGMEELTVADGDVVLFLLPDAPVPVEPTATLAGFDVPPAVGTVPAEPAAAAADWRTVAFSIWLVVVALLSMRFAWIQVRTLRIARRARSVRSGELNVDLDELRARSGVRRTVDFRITDAIETPAAGGLWRPYVLLPQGLLGQLDDRPLRWVLLHELAHIRRGDVAVALLQRLMQIAFFFHPAVWIANKIIDEQREFVCDEDALARSDVKRRECGAGFLSVVEWAHGRECGPASTLGMFHQNQVIRRRLMRLLHRRQHGALARALSGALAATVAMFVVPSASATAESALESPAVEAQDPELAKLRKRLAELEEAQRLLRKAIERLSQDNDDDGTERGRRWRPGIVEVEADEDEVEDEVEADEDESDFRVVEIDGDTLLRVDGKRVERIGIGDGKKVRWIRPDGTPLKLRGKFENESGEVVYVTPEGAWRKGKSGRAVYVDPEDPSDHAGRYTLRSGDGVYVIRDGQLERLKLPSKRGVYRIDGDGKPIEIKVDGRYRTKLDPGSYEVIRPDVRYHYEFETKDGGPEFRYHYGNDENSPYLLRLDGDQPTLVRPAKKKPKRRLY